VNSRSALQLFLVTGAGEDREARIFEETRIGEGEFAEDENGAVGGFDGAGMDAGSAEASVRWMGHCFGRICHVRSG
jgi:hypothetical protein